LERSESAILMVKERAKHTKEELREDEFVERIMQAVDFVQARYQWFIGALIALVVIVLGVNHLITVQQQTKIDAATKLGEFLIAEGDGDLQATMQQLQELTTRYEGTPAAAQGVLLLANRYYIQGNYQEAQQLYESYLKKYGHTNILAYGAWNGIGACMKARGELLEAARHYQQFASRHSGTFEAALALWEAARCYAQSGDFEGQRNMLEQLTRQYSQLPLVEQAKTLLAGL
jgi:outer membrane protein assembly factor BamD (BamD/ComL family)